MSRCIYILYVIVILVYLALILLMFYPFTECTDFPILKYDFAHHYINTINTAKYFQFNFNDLGYNPFFAAGLGEHQESSNRIFIPFFSLLNTDSPLLFNILVFITLGILPLLFQFATASVAQSSDIGKVAGIGAVFVLVGSRIGQEFMFVGHFSFLLSIFLSICAAALLWNFFQRPKLSLLVFHALCAGLSCWTHLLAPLTLAPLLLLIIAISWNKGKVMQVVHVFIAWLLFVLAPNLVWIPNVLNHLKKYYKPNDMDLFLQSNFDSAIRYLMDPLFVLMVTFISLGVIFLKIAYKRWMISILPCTFYFLIIAAFGSQLGLADIQPARFYLPFFLLLIMFVSSVKSRWLLPGMLVLGLVVIGRVTWGEYFQSKQGCGLTDSKGTSLFTFIEKRLDKDVRLHVQDSESVPYFHTRITAIIPKYSKQPILSAPYFLPIRFESFVDDKIFGRNLVDFEPKDLIHMSDIYNVGYYLVFSDTATKYFSSSALFSLIYQDDPFEIYELVTRSNNYGLGSTVDVVIDLNRIEVRHTDTRVTILKFHTFTSFKIDPPSIKYVPFEIPGDPRPFIKVLNGDVTRFVIYYK